ncbi:hypothetical protein [Salinicola salarius]|uniref:hypothetical protein n=1 Tax=Salinicola salarius TaxID=430457 RepID=UPI000DA15459|nr:hypothetical protein [Salinicola salarius]
MSPNITQPSILSLIHVSENQELNLVKTTRSFSTSMHQSAAVADGLEAMMSRYVDDGEHNEDMLRSIQCGSALLADRLREQAKALDELSGRLAAAQAEARSHE